MVLNCHCTSDVRMWSSTIWLNLNLDIVSFLFPMDESPDAKQSDG
jgi:hypothetical protein